MSPKRRISDALRAVDGLVDSHLQQAPIDARVLAQLAVTMLIEFSGASCGALLLDDGLGLKPRFALGPGLAPVATDTMTFDPALLAEAESTRRSVSRDRRIATPVILGGKVRGMLYLEAGSEPLEADAEALAAGVATRIATLLHSASLVEDAARRAKNVEVLEALGACLSAGELTDQHLDQTLDAALHSTASAEALLAILDEHGELLALHLRGSDPDPLRALGADLARRLGQGEISGLGTALGTESMVEPLWGDLVPTRDGAPPRRPLGYLAVRRPAGRPYLDAEQTIFRALAHLLAVALARLKYFRKAAEDTLTGTGSRLALDLAIVEAVEHARRSGLALSAVLVDIDHFKQINDTHGHQVGDAILKGVATALRARLRARDFVARYGGDEFLVLLPQTAPDEAAHLAEELRNRVATQVYTEAHLKVSLSLGVAGFPLHATTSSDLIRRADQALYLSKAAGRNRVTMAPAPPALPPESD